MLLKYGITESTDYEVTLIRHLLKNITVVEV